VTNAIEVRNLAKQYRLGQTMTFSLRDELTRRVKGVKSDSKRFWALTDVTFDVPQGQILGIIGKNGAGKSTLLKILSRITEPSEGEVHLWGRVSSLLEVGTGFHPELSGRENVYLNGSILGMGRIEIRSKLDEIIEFAEIRQFIDTPVKRYSSGMYVRLAFSVAAHLEPDILLIDEVLAVGDAAFQEKCLGRIEGSAKEGRTIIMVSHNTNVVSRLCDRVIWLAQGEIREDGHPAHVISHYLSEGKHSAHTWSPDQYIPGSPIRIEAVQLSGFTGADTAFGAQEPIAVIIDFETLTDIAPTHFSLNLLTEDGQRLVISLSSDALPNINHPFPKGRHRYECRIPGGLLRPGRYFITLWEPDGITHIEREGILSFIVTEEGSLDARHGIYATIAPVFTWKLDA